MILTWSTGAAGHNMSEDILTELAGLIERHPWFQARAQVGAGRAAALAVFSVPGATFLRLRLRSVPHRSVAAEPFVMRHETVAPLVLAALSCIALHRGEGKKVVSL